MPDAKGLAVSPFDHLRSHRNSHRMYQKRAYGGKMLETFSQRPTRKLCTEKSNYFDFLTFFWSVSACFCDYQRRILQRDGERGYYAMELRDLDQRLLESLFSSLGGLVTLYRCPEIIQRLMVPLHARCQ
jgi:hypothetical protein